MTVPVTDRAFATSTLCLVVAYVVALLLSIVVSLLLVFHHK